MEPAYELSFCPVCHARDDEEVASREAIVREMEDLWTFHIRRLRSDTPQRFLLDRLVFSQDPPLRLGRCRQCGTLFRNPRERGRDLVELYAEERVDPTVLRGLFDAQKQSYQAQARRLTGVVGRAGRALEVGSYVGGFQAAARELGWSVEGVDVNPAAAAFARSAGFCVHEGEIAAAPMEAPYDAVAIWNCFDQLSDPLGVVRAARERLRPGGVFAVRVPNGAFYLHFRRGLEGPGAPFARAALAHNNLLGFPYRTGYTPSSLAVLLRACGFEPMRVIGDTLVPIGDRWTRGWARMEERAVKRLLSITARGNAAPWLEVFARAPDATDTQSPPAGTSTA